MYISGYPGNFNPNFQAIIPISTTETQEIKLAGFVLCGIKVPAAFTGTALTFEMCDVSGGTYVPVVSGTSGTALSYTVAQGKYYAIDPKDFQGINYLKIKSGSTEVAARTLVISLKGL